MSFKKILTAALCLSLFFVAGCNTEKDTSSIPNTSIPVSSDDVSSEEIIEPEFAINPLTGTEDLDPAFANKRPVAIMINNISVAQSVQCGLSNADIIYETEVEQGITRLMAVFQNVSAVNQIGTIRSARYAYIDLAMGHNAIYCHHGQDPAYAKPHLKHTTAFEIHENNAGKRLSNGKAKEHTLYTYGNKLWSVLSSSVKVENKNSGTWQNFVSQEEVVNVAGGVANNVTIPFSRPQKTTFTYDVNTGKYLRYSNGVALADYSTGAKVNVKNIFVLLTSITNYSDGYHRNVNLSSGKGYYVTNGAYTEINWSKGNASSPIKFTNLDGTPLEVNAGKSYVAFMNKNTGSPSFN